MENRDQMDKAAQGKTHQELERDITETRHAIGSDLRALGEKFNPTVLKDEAREMINDAKEGAKEVIRDARDAAADSFRSAKEQAMGAVNETVHDIKDEARRVTHATTAFVSRNAIPLTLIGLGVGWLMMSRREPSYGHYGSRARALAADNAGTADSTSSMSVVKRKVVSVGHQGAEMAREVGNKAAHLTHDLSHEAAMQWERGRQGAVDLARDNPLAIGAAAVAVGVGLGLVLPATRWENEWMGQTRDRLLDETKELAGDIRHSTERVGRGAREALAEVRHAVDSPAGSGV